MFPDFGFAGVDLPFCNRPAVWEAAAGLMFCAALARAPSPTLRLFAAAPLVLTILHVLSPAIGMIPMLVRAAMALVVLYLGLANWVLIRAAANGNRDALIVVPGIILLSGIVLWDLTSILDPGFSRVFIPPAAYHGFLLRVDWLMALDFCLSS